MGKEGVVPIVFLGFFIPLVQTLVEDAGFDDLDIIPLGAGEIFIRCLSNVDM